MASRERGREGLDANKYPIFGMFGPEPRRLTKEQALLATTDERIESVWRFLVRRTLRFIDTLRGCESANYDAEDILMELYIELRIKDDKWEPARGRYITFAARLAQRHLSGLRDRARTVQSPRNSSSRMQEYQREMDSGTITEDRRRTFDDIRRSVAHYGSVSLEHGESEEHDETIDRRERERLDRDAITWGLMALTPFEARVLGMSSGLWGKPSLSTSEIAERTGKSRDAVKRAKDDAVLKVKERLLAMGHPAVASDN